jgi:putative ABC transport system substrate-binding protein
MNHYGRSDRVRRRDFITLLSGAAGWPLAARGQQSALPVVGFLNSASPATYSHLLGAFRLGLKESGFIEGENVTIEYRWAENEFDRLPVLARESVRRQVAVIAATGGIHSALAAKAATSTIPVVFNIGDDPVRLGLVASVARPGGNVTGVNNFIYELVAKRLALLRELVPSAVRVAVLVNPATAQTETTLRDVEAAARPAGLQIQIAKASTPREIDAAFAALARDRVDGLFVPPDPLFISRRIQLVQLVARHALPATYPVRDFAETGGLMSYGTNTADAWHQTGVYTGRILKGTTPAELPVLQPTKFELVINAQTARMLDLTVPPSLFATADEVIE